MALSDADKARARKHLGYPNVDPSFGFNFGDPVSTQQSWTFEEGLVRLRAEAEPQVLEILDQLDLIECQIKKVPGILFAEVTAGGTRPNKNAGDDLEKEFQRWAFRLCDLLNCIPNPHAARFRSRSRVGNIRVV